MQNKGTLGSLIAGIIAVFLVLVCAFYLSFSAVSNHYEGKAQDHAAPVAGGAGTGAEQDAEAYKAYTDSISKGPLLLGYN